MAQFDDLRKRSKRFAMDVISLYRVLLGTEEARIIGRQLLRSGTSVAANYGASCRARSKAEFVSKIGVVVEEADESVLWLELLTETGIVPSERTAALMKEANELLAIFAASYHTAKYKSTSSQ